MSRLFDARRACDFAWTINRRRDMKVSLLDKDGRQTKEEGVLETMAVFEGAGKVVEADCAVDASRADPARSMEQVKDRFDCTTCRISCRTRIPGPGENILRVINSKFLHKNFDFRFLEC